MKNSKFSDWDVKKSDDTVILTRKSGWMSDIMVTLVTPVMFLGTFFIAFCIIHFPLISQWWVYLMLLTMLGFFSWFSWLLIKAWKSNMFYIKKVVVFPKAEKTEIKNILGIKRSVPDIPSHILIVIHYSEAGYGCSGSIKFNRFKKSLEIFSILGYNTEQRAFQNGQRIAGAFAETLNVPVQTNS